MVEDRVTLAEAIATTLTIPCPIHASIIALSTLKLYARDHDTALIHILHDTAAGRVCTSVSAAQRDSQGTLLANDKAVHVGTLLAPSERTDDPAFLLRASYTLLI